MNVVAPARAGVEWVAGIGHPTFVWDDNNIPADYTAVDAAIARATALDSSLYTNYSAVEDSINSVDRAKSKAQQTEVDAMAKAIEDAIAALQYKDADYTKVDAAIAKANALNKDIPFGLHFYRHHLGITLNNKIQLKTRIVCVMVINR